MPRLPPPLAFTLTLLVACTPLDSGPVTESSSTTAGSPDSGTTESETAATDPTGTTSPTTGSSGTTAESTSTTADAGSSSTTESLPSSDSDTEAWDTTGDECDFTCGVSIECEHPDVEESQGADPCLEGFHCENASACGCAVTYCHMNCDPDDPGSCPGKKVCDAVSGECVDP